HGGFWSANTYTSAKMGTWTVRGTYNGTLTDDASLTVNPGTADHIIISPGTAIITAGSSQAYTAVAYDEFENSLGDVTSSTNFSISSGAGGSWGGYYSNVYTPANAGTWIVAGYYGGLTDTASLTVNAGSAARLEVTGSATMTAGGTNELTITARDSYGNVATSYTGARSLTFSGPASAPGGQIPRVEGVAIGSSVLVTFTGGISNTGAASLVAYRAESTTVDVSDGSIGSSGSTSYDLDLTVNPGPPVTLALTPVGGSAIAGVPFGVTVTAYDAYGNAATGYLGTVRFTSTDSAATLPSDYTFVSGDSGAHTFSVALISAGSQSVTVTDTGNAALTDTESWTVNPGTSVDHIVIFPDTSDVVAGDNVTYMAQAFDGFNNPIGDVTSMTVFEIDAAAGGAWSGTYSNVYTSHTAGIWVVTGTYGVLTDTAGLMVNAGALHHIVISPDTGTVTAGQTQTYTVEAFDRCGNSLGDVTGETAFQTDAAAAGSWSANTYTSEKAGGWTVMGTYGTLSSTASLVVNPGAIDHYGVTSPSYDQQANVAFTVTVTAYDAFDNVVNDSSTLVTMSSDSGNVSFDANGDGIFDDSARTLANGTFTITAKCSGAISAMTITAASGSASGTSPAYTVAADPALVTPVAADDSYEVSQDTILMGAAPGVLANDTGAEGDSLTAVLVSSVSHGTLRLKPDGSFSYTPEAGFSGADSFTYKAVGSVAESNIATVTINVKGGSKAIGVSPWVFAGPALAVLLLAGSLVWYRHYWRRRGPGRKVAASAPTAALAADTMPEDEPGAEGLQPTEKRPDPESVAALRARMARLNQEAGNRPSQRDG
ncbi:MAG: Ig-like domain-containing protein, partial [Dehalococcoidia bacterium]|nr:Ig-like domain-containing protein [Dehalococcoidia bacterium]